MRSILFRILITAGLTMLGCWICYYAWPLRSVRYEDYTYSEEEANHLRFYPKAQYAHGMQVWLQQKPEQAAGFFRQAVTQNVLFFDAWLRLAESEAAMGNAEKARAILTFISDRTDDVFRWKWPQMVLALELGMETCFYRNANDLLSHQVLQQDTLQLLHTHLDGDASAVIAVLQPAHLATYLDWLTDWGMTEESLTVWQALKAVTRPEKETALRYAHFLLNNKRIAPSVEIWRKYTGINGLTNPGFETDITGQGFDWRHWDEKDRHWELKRVKDETAEGDYALRISFNGRENISFQHLLQIFTATPQAHYRLTYAWKGSRITTDQGPFVEIFSYDNPGLYRAGPMLTGTCGWREASIEFDMPADCHAAVVRLRRKSSMRFDAKINGKVWIDNFRLESVE